jgi:hypothetical protein
MKTLKELKQEIAEAAYPPVQKTIDSFVIKLEMEHPGGADKFYFVGAGKDWTKDIKKAKQYKTKEEYQRVARRITVGFADAGEPRDVKYQKKYQSLINKLKKALKKEGLDFKKYMLKGSESDLVLVVGHKGWVGEFGVGNQGDRALEPFEYTKGWGGILPLMNDTYGYETLDWIVKRR